MHISKFHSFYRLKQLFNQELKNQQPASFVNTEERPKTPVPWNVECSASEDGASLQFAESDHSVSQYQGTCVIQWSLIKYIPKMRH